MFRKVLDAVLKHKKVAGISTAVTVACIAGAVVFLTKGPITIKDELVAHIWIR